MATATQIVNLEESTPFVNGRAHDTVGPKKHAPWGSVKAAKERARKRAEAREARALIALPPEMHKRAKTRAKAKAKAKDNGNTCKHCKREFDTTKALKTHVRAMHETSPQKKRAIARKRLATMEANRAALAATWVPAKKLVPAKEARTAARTVRKLPSPNVVSLADALAYVKTKRDWLNEVIADFERFEARNVR